MRAFEGVQEALLLFRGNWSTLISRNALASGFRSKNTAKQPGANALRLIVRRNQQPARAEGEQVWQPEPYCFLTSEFLHSAAAGSRVKELTRLLAIHVLVAKRFTTQAS
jgi:hypothetical protein